MIKGTIIHYYIFCKRRCFLHAHNITCEDNSELVKIGKFFHEERQEQKNLQDDLLEVELDSVKIDQINNEFVTEFKKKDSDTEACLIQLKYYLYILEKHGIKRRGKLIFKESKKVCEVKLTDNDRYEIESITKEINKLILSTKIPVVLNEKKCKKCAYYEFCYS